MTPRPGRRVIASTGLTVPPIGLGCLPMTDFYGPGDAEAGMAAVRRALEIGMGFLDTADVYGSGANEELVGRAIEGHRDEAVVATKFGNVLNPDGTFGKVDGRPEYVKRACEASLRRLRVDVIDLYYQHRVDVDVPIEETVGAMADLVRAGKVRHLGLSEAGAGTLRRAHAVHPISALQSEYSLWSRDPEEEVLPACRELGIGFVAYSPLGRGLLSGRVTDQADLSADDRRRHLPRFQGDNLVRNLRVVESLRAFADAKGWTLAQVALAWLLSRGADVVPIAGSKRARHVEENARAAALELSTQDLRRLDELVPPGAVAGDRYHEAGMRKLGR